MLAEDARSLARRWVHEQQQSLPDFRGAVWHGSIIDLPSDAEMDSASDVDLILVLDDPDAAPPSGKQMVDGVLLDVSTVGWESIRDPERLLADHSLAPSFRDPQLLADPTGELAALRDAVAEEFAQRHWVERRRDSALGRLRRFLAQIDAGGLTPSNVMSWLFGTGVTTHVLLVAGLRNPTVRKRYVAVRSLLVDVGLPDVQGTLLEQLGSRDLSPERAEFHLQALAPAFDTTISAIHSPFPYASDLTRASRPIAIGGSRAMIEAGDHREAMFWIAVTWTRCMQVLETDAPDHARIFTPDFHAVLADLGITSLKDIQRRAAAVQAYLPTLETLSDRIMDATPEIERAMNDKHQPL